MNLARAAIGCAIVGVPLWLLSYSWVPFAAAGREMGGLSPLPLVGELGALLAAVPTVALSRFARNRSQPGTAEHRLGSRAFTMGLALLALIVIPNIVGALAFLAS